MLQQSYDYVIVGAGTFGLSTTYFLARENSSARICLIEQHAIGHDEGSSHSQSRIIRSTYRNDFYRKLCLLGIDTYWPQVEQDLQEKFIIPNPCISIIDKEEQFLRFKQVADSSEGHLKILSCEELRKRFPTMPMTNSRFPYFLDTKSGVIYAEKYLKCLDKSLRSRANVHIFQKTKVDLITNTDKGVFMRVCRQGQQFTIHSPKVMLSCGRWISGLFPMMNSLTTVARQTIGYFQTKNMSSYQIGQFPCWIHQPEDSIVFYGLPDVTGIGIKFAQHCSDPDLEKKCGTEEKYMEIKRQQLLVKAKEYFGPDMKLVKLERCYYTVTKTEDFILDWSDPHENILICSTCSGHGFKFSPVIGKIAVDLLRSDHSVQLFEKNRHIFRLTFHEGVYLQ